MEQFIINSVDYTNNIVYPTYKVNNTSVYDEWEDGNRVKHKSFARNKIKGSFTMKFFDAISFNNFFTALKTNRTQAGYVLASVFVVNENRLATGNFFIDCEPANVIPQIGMANFEGFDVTIEEA